MFEYDGINVSVLSLYVRVRRSLLGVAQLVERWLAEFDSRLIIPWRHLLISGEAMKIQDDGPRQMMKDERMYDCTV
jgi:hypothetical protein